MDKITIFWHRRDLRIDDNSGLHYSLKAHNNVLPLFVFDTSILNDLEDEDDQRLTFIHQQLQQLKKKYEEEGSSILVFYGTPLEAFKQIKNDYHVEAVYTNHDYEPYAKDRDQEIITFFQESSIPYKSFKDQVIFEKSEIVKDDGDPYVVYTPYSKKWKNALTSDHIEPCETLSLLGNLYKVAPLNFPSLEVMGFKCSKKPIPEASYQKSLVKRYDETRNFPGIQGTSQLGVHLRFGTISIRNLVKRALEDNEKYLNELIWREFYMQILWHFPQVVNQSFRPIYDQVPWENNEEHFKKWCEGNTGYPIVDAGMRELNTTGYMHNRVRMIVASFLTKHLLIDWRWGEAYFARKLLDFELSSNNGGWQWAAGSGVDAAPYFRIFNPYTQTDKFDKQRNYIKKWVPEYADPFTYPKPIVDHKEARERTLEAYKVALNR